MPHLALIGNPPPPGYRRPNPVAFTGPSFTFMPFNPFQKFAVDLVGASWRSQKKNPYQHTSPSRGDRGWEVPPRLWPQNMSGPDFDRWAQSQIGFPIQVLLRNDAYKIPDKDPNYDPQAVVRLQVVNRLRQRAGKPELTYEEHRRWVIVDVIGQLYEEEEMRQQGPGFRSPVVTEGRWHRALIEARRAGVEREFSNAHRSGHGVRESLRYALSGRARSEAHDDEARRASRAAVERHREEVMRANREAAWAAEAKVEAGRKAQQAEKRRQAAAEAKAEAQAAQARTHSKRESKRREHESLVRKIKDLLPVYGGRASVLANALGVQPDAIRKIVKGQRSGERMAKSIHELHATVTRPAPGPGRSLPISAPTFPKVDRYARGHRETVAAGGQMKFLIDELLRIYGQGLKSNGQARLAEALNVGASTLQSVIKGRVKLGADLAKRLVELAVHNGIAAMNPSSMPRQRNRDHRWRKPPNVEEISLDDAADYPGYDRALKAHRRFHGTDPGRAMLVRVPQKGRKQDELAGGTVHVMLGEREQTPYMVPWDESKKAGVRWYHDHPEDTRPMILLNPETGLTTDVGGTYMVDDWFYS
jgi:plasmid maintenance system antidote protein VapI